MENKGTGASDLPTISVVVPTFNSESVLEECLRSVSGQKYPKTAVEIIIVDAGSTDGTLKIAEKYARRILHNPLQTGEAGKAIGIRGSSGELVALVDSDNVLPDEGWFERMVSPFHDPEVAAVEPISYSYRNDDGPITRYCALLGMNDPICLFLGNYDRCSYLTGRWTDIDLIQEDLGPYIKVQLDCKRMPTIGANGLIFRRGSLGVAPSGDYFFDLDAACELASQGGMNFVKVKTGIVHIFSGSLATFARKQRRRIADYLHFRSRNLRIYPWLSVNKVGYLKFVMFTVLVVPLFCQALIGYRRKPDPAWLFHIPACWITLIVYSTGFIQGTFRPAMAKRENWRSFL